jgi:aspartate/tyrosine/aromatic aminotransferase
MSFVSKAASLLPMTPISRTIKAMGSTTRTSTLGTGTSLINARFPEVTIPVNTISKRVLSTENTLDNIGKVNEKMKSFVENDGKIILNGIRNNEIELSDKHVQALKSTFCNTIDMAFKGSDERLNKIADQIRSEVADRKGSWSNLPVTKEQVSTLAESGFFISESGKFCASNLDMDNMQPFVMALKSTFKK